MLCFTKLYCTVRYTIVYGTCANSRIHTVGVELSWTHVRGQTHAHTRTRAHTCTHTHTHRYSVVPPTPLHIAWVWKDVSGKGEAYPQYVGGIIALNAQVCVFVCVCARVRVCVCVRASMCMCVRVCCA